MYAAVSSINMDAKFVYKCSVSTYFSYVSIAYLILLIHENIKCVCNVVRSLKETGEAADTSASVPFTLHIETLSDLASVTAVSNSDVNLRYSDVDLRSSDTDLRSIVIP